MIYLVISIQFFVKKIKTFLKVFIESLSFISVGFLWFDMIIAKIDKKDQAIFLRRSRGVMEQRKYKTKQGSSHSRTGSGG